MLDIPLELFHVLPAHKDIFQVPMVKYVHHAQQLTHHAHGLVVLHLVLDGQEHLGQPVQEHPLSQPANGALEVLKLPYHAKHHTI